MCLYIKAEAFKSVNSSMKQKKTLKIDKNRKKMVKTFKAVTRWVNTRLKNRPLQAK